MVTHAAARRHQTRPSPVVAARLAAGAATPAAGVAARPRVVVLGDLMVDVVLRPERSLETGTDVPGRVALRAGGSAANAARWLGRLGATITLIGAVGRDAAGRALAAAVLADGATARLVRVAGARTGRIGVLVAPGGERSFVADRGAADQLRPEDLQPGWFAGASLLHLPVYSLLGEPLGLAGRRAIELARAAGALVSVDLASIGPLLAGGRPAALALIQEAAPDLLFATAGEAEALLGQGPDTDTGTAALLDLAPLVVLKRGARGATVIRRDPAGQLAAGLRLDVPAERVVAADSTGAGDAFDAGFILGWLARRDLRRAALAGHRAARRQLAARHRELPLL